MDSKPTRVDPRVLRTKQLIKEAFIDLLREMDIEKISVNRIAERATINRVTFYLHYQDIPDMLEKLSAEMRDELSRLLKSPEPSGPAEEESDWPMLVRLLEHIADNEKIYKVILASKRIPIFVDALLSPIVEMITDKIETMDEGSFLAKANIPKDFAVWFCSSALMGTISAWLRQDSPYTPRYMAKQFSLLLPYYFK
ncbi:TetR/AcrR family transcriptional regulator [Paenibacillus physcomitrellae]|uniref:TetR family transcriptional regulator n=1 Tax=Paenibacillus physcomitrellae TaxID=1619311 RepID=A0ABQ1FT10_9BACL|nr:TetR-like C-terminal domain-containing protein [Paenibacillus physcomitrellae]GGA29843.1 TetR family transcriptional regulator [Paenibacillus physcomitrellae]